MRYPEWHKEVSDLLASERPDITPEDLDPNGTYSAHQRGLTPRQFVGGHLPIKGTVAPPPVAGSVPPTDFPRNGPAPNSLTWLWWILGIIFGGGAVIVLALFLMYTSSVADSEKRTCQTNMQTIANGVQAYKVSTRAEKYPMIPNVADEIGQGKVLEFLMIPLQCPASTDNTYSVTLTEDGGFTVRCTELSHGRWANGAIID